MASMMRTLCKVVTPKYLTFNEYDIVGGILLYKEYVVGLAIENYKFNSLLKRSFWDKACYYYDFEIKKWPRPLKPSHNWLQNQTL
jgi:hypothetical protein